MSGIFEAIETGKNFLAASSFVRGIWLARSSADLYRYELGKV
jgi:hypothetical protein